MMGLTTNQATKVENNTLCLVTLANNGDVGLLKSRKFLLVSLALTLELLGNLLLEHKCFQSIVTLLLSTRQASSEALSIVLLLIDETSKTSVFTLVVLNLNLEILSLFGKLFGKGLEFEELVGFVRNRFHDATGVRLTCCFQLSNSSTKKLFRLETFPSSVSMRPLRLMKSCHASRASREYWLRSRTISLRCLMETLVINGFFTAPPNTAFIPVFRPYETLVSNPRLIIISPANIRKNVKLTIFSQT